ncbi:exosome complex component RRP46-like isoform X2 [Babylonia areolata]
MENQSTVETSVPCLAAMRCVLGDISQADGSASLTHSGTSVLAAVYGPCEVRMSKEILDKATVEVFAKPKAGLPNCADKFREQHIREVFQSSLLVSQHPRSSITIVTQELEDEGALLATSINASCLALLDASVNMKFLVAAATAVIDRDGNITLAPQEKQTSEDILATLTVVFCDKNYSIIGVTSSGKFSTEQYDKCVALCREASLNVFQFYRESMEKKLSKLM